MGLKFLQKSLPFYVPFSELDTNSLAYLGSKQS